MAYPFLPSPNHWKGRSKKTRSIVIHWWGDPKNNPKFDDVVAHLRKPSSQVSAHYVVSDRRVVQLVAEKDTAWHARSANPFSIGIEVDPNTPGATYETVGKLVREIRKRHGNLPLEKHSRYVATQCPGTIDLDKINALARGGIMLTDALIDNFFRIVENRKATAAEKKGWRGRPAADLIKWYRHSNRFKNIQAAEKKRDEAVANLVEENQELTEDLSEAQQEIEQLKAENAKDETDHLATFFNWLINLFKNRKE